MTASNVNNYSGEAVVVSIIFVLLAAIFVGARFFVRFGILQAAGADDWIILASLLFAFAVTVITWTEDHYGLGRHLVTLSHGQYVILLKLVWLNAPFYNLSLTFTKISIILLYLRVFVGKHIRRACFIMMAIVIAYGCWNVPATIFACNPVPYYWEKTIKGGKCQNKMVLWFTIAALRIATDLAIFALPMPVFASLQLPRKQRMILMGIFAIGGFVCLTSLLRLRHLYVLAKSKDLPWDNVQAATWSNVEINLGIICACLPTLRPLIRRFFPRVLATTCSHSASRVARSESHLVTPGVNPDDGVAVHDAGLPDEEVALPVREKTKLRDSNAGVKGLQDLELELLSLSTDSSSPGATPKANV